MKNKKNYEVADILELIKISNEFVERNRKVYERLAAGIPTQGIMDSLVGNWSIYMAITWSK